MSKIYTKTLLKDEAREALKRGIDAVYQPVAATIGARGRNAIYRYFGMPKITNDGVSIADQIIPEDEFELLGADLIKDVARKTVREAGDGTTSSIILAHALAEGATKSSVSSIELQAQLESAKDQAVKALKKLATPIKDKNDLLNVIKVSIENDEMAKIVADAVEKAGEHGAVVVEEGAGFNTEVEEVKGYHWDRGYVSAYMMTSPEREEAILEDVPVILTDRHMNLNKDLMQTLNELVAQGHKGALVVVEAMEGELLQSVIVNKLNGRFTAVVVRKPQTQEELEDIAILTNGTACTKDKGIKQINYSHMGKVKKVIVKKDKTVILGEDSPSLQDRVKQLQEQVKEIEDDEAKSFLTARIAKLTDGMIMIRVGSKTDAERSYKKDKMDDAVSAAKAAQEEGYVPGGGVAFTAVGSQITDDTEGARILREALAKPYERILTNAGIEPDGNFYNVHTGKKVKDMVKEGIIDPAKVTRSVIENAVSFAKVFLTTESVTARFERKDVHEAIASVVGQR